VNRYKIIFFIPLILLILILISLHRILFSSGMIAMADWGIPFYPYQISNAGKSSLYSWGHHLLFGHPLGGAYFSYWLFFTILGITGLNGATITRLVVVLLLFLSGCSAFYFSRYFKRSYSVSFVLAIYYMFSPLIFNWTLMGFLPLILAYALLPLAFVFFVKSLKMDTGWLKYSIIAGLIYSIASIQPQVVILYATLFVMYSIITLFFSEDKGIDMSKWHKKLWPSVLIPAIIIIIMLLVNNYWIIPQFHGASILKSAMGGGKEEIALREYSVNSFIETIRFMGFHSPQYEGAVRKVFLLRLLSFVPLILAFCTPILKTKDKNVIFFLILSLILLTLSLGKYAPYPFGDIFLYGYNKSIFLQMFRGTYKFWMLISLAYLFLIGETIHQLYLKNKKTHKFFFTIAMLLMILVSIPHFLSGYFAKKLQTIDLPEGYSVINNYINKDKEDFKVLWLPSDAHMLYPNSRIDIRDINTFSFKSGSISFSAFGVSGQDIGVRFNQFLSYTINDGNTNNFASFLGSLGIKYVVCQNNIGAGFWQQYSQKGLIGDDIYRNLLKQKGLKEVMRIGYLHLFENNNFISPINLSKPLLMVGDRGFLIAKDYLDVLSMKKNAMVFFNQEELKNISHFANVLFYRKSFDDIVFKEINKKYEIPLSKYADGFFGVDKWTSLFNWYFFRKWEYTSSIDDPIIAGGTNKKRAELSFDYKVEDQQEYVVLIKAFCGGDAGDIKLIIGENHVLELDMNSRFDQGFRWIEMGRIDLKSDIYEVRLVSDSGENVISRLIIMPSKYLKVLKNRAGKFLFSKNIAYLFEAEDSDNLVNGIKERNPRFEDINASQRYVLSGKDVSDNLSYSFYFPKRSDYLFSLRLRVHDKTRLLFSIDNDKKSISLESTSDYKWIDIAHDTVDKGFHKLILQEKGLEKVDIDMIMVRSGRFNRDSENSVRHFKYNKINPVKAIIDLDIAEPLYLIFNETFHPDWRASIGDKDLKHFIVNSFANVFFIDKVGKSRIVLEFTRQRQYTIGLMISLITVIACLVVIILPNKKHKKK